MKHDKLSNALRLNLNYLNFLLTIFGTAPNPCPKVCAPVEPVYLQIEKPDVVFAETEDVNVPDVLLDDVPPANQFHAT